MITVTQEPIRPEAPVFDEPLVQACRASTHEFCVNTPVDFETLGFEWTVPPDASFTLNADSSCATIDF